MEIKFTLKRPKAKTSTLQTEFMKSGVPIKLYIGKTINTENWLRKKQEVKRDEPNYDLINRFLRDWKNNVCRIIEQFELDKKRITKELIQEELNKIYHYRLTDKEAVKTGSENDFIAFYDNFIKDNKSRWSSTVLSMFNQNRKHVICALGLVPKNVLRDYQALSIKARSKMELTPTKLLPFDQINDAFFSKVVNYLQTATFTMNKNGVELVLNYKKNQIAAHVKTLKQVIKPAFKKGVPHFDLDDFKASHEEVDTVFTDFNELQLLLDLSLAGLEKIVRDRYVLNCFLGMRFSDLKRIKKHLFADRILSGRKCVVYKGRQVKTQNIVEFPIHKNAVKILEEYNYDIPEVSDTEFNRILKIVGEKAGLTILCRIRETRGQNKTEHNDIPKFQLLSSHSGRRSFCTNYL